MFLPQCKRLSLTPIQNNRQNYSIIHNVKRKIKQKPHLYGLLFLRRHCLNYKDHTSMEEKEEEEEEKKNKKKKKKKHKINITSVSETTQAGMP